MPSTDPNLGLNYGWTLGESGWNAGMDANLKKLGAVVHLSAKSRAVGAPPASPANGDRYIIPASATGGWSGRDGQIAVRINGVWEYYTAAVGWVAYVEDENKQVIYTSQGWTLVDDVLELGTMANQDADNVNITGGQISADIVGGTFHGITPTQAGLVLLDDADAAAQRATLGLGTAATKNVGTSGDTVPLLSGNNTFSGTTVFNTGFARTPTVSTAPDGSTITLASATNHLLYNNASVVTSLTINLPTSNVVDGQEITIATRSAITALTVSAGSTPVYGAPTTLPAGGFATFIYSSVAGAWFRKG